ncbi:hypothetical protein GCM10007857_63230 [Bradyrhizobium iriomotense]|uniref:Transposase n=1 Tax=Bradyrhizobium iriomotense TaxID=441950 RepID=A0ABQ6B5E6_9BRAD|nr:hypothetical protein GCM10007857_63230 [Bradyrhizobium iriomotense]
MPSQIRGSSKRGGVGSMPQDAKATAETAKISGKIERTTGKQGRKCSTADLALPLDGRVRKAPLRWILWFEWELTVYAGDRGT